MAWKEYSFELPEFLFATVPEIDGSFNDIRTWIYHTASCSLIEFSLVNDLVDFEIEDKECFIHINSDGEMEWYVIVVTLRDNVEGKISPHGIVEKAKKVFVNHLNCNDERFGL